MNGAAHVHGGEQGQQGNNPFCFFHPRDLVVGVCAHCLRDRLLLVLASKHAPGGRARSPTDGASYLSSRPYYRTLRRKTGSISLPKVFALGSFLQRLDSSRHHRPDDADNNSAAADDTASVASLDGTPKNSHSINHSFISIKFEDNGKATWDSQKAKAADGEAPKADKAPATLRPTTVVVEHVKRGGVTRWRKQVLGRLLQLARWKRSGKQAGGAVAACHVDQRSKGGRAGRSWIRSLTRRRAAHGERAWS